MSNIMLKKEPLPSGLVERGEITKQLLYCDDEIEVAILELSNDAAIAVHPHPNSREIYFGAETFEVLDEVEVGGEHGYINNTGETLRILAVKFYV